MAATSTKGLAPNERETLFKTLQGLIQNGDVPLEDFNSLVAELNQTTKSQQEAFHDSHLSDIFAADEFGDFAAAEGGSDPSIGMAGQMEAAEWPDESEHPFPDDFIAATDATALFDFSELTSSSRSKASGQSRGRNSSDNGTVARGRSRNTRSKPKKAAEEEEEGDEISSTWEPFDVQESSFSPPKNTSTPVARRKQQSKVDGSTTTKTKPPQKREAANEACDRDTKSVPSKETAENIRRRTSSSHRKSRESDLDTSTRTPTKTREKTRSLSRKKKDGETSKHRENNGTKNLDAVLAHMLTSSAENNNKDNLTTSGDTATTSSETKATLSEEAQKKSPRKKVVKKVAAGIRADDVSTILKAIESGMIETNAAGKIVVRMAKPKKKQPAEERQKGASLSRVLDSQKLTMNGSTENRSVSSAPVQATERLPGAGLASPAAQQRRSRSRKSRPEEEETRGHERSKSQGR